MEAVREPQIRRETPSWERALLARARLVVEVCLSTHIGLAIFTAFAFAMVYRFGERIEIRNGLGDDGSLYGEWAQNAWQVIKAKEKLDGYYIQRVFPSWLVWAVHKVTKIAPSDRATIRGFAIANGVLVGLSTWSYSRVARRLRFSERARFFGAICLFGSFGVIKWMTFCPVLTDLWALGLGMFFLQCHLERRPILLAIAIVIGAFCWPSAMQIGCILLFCMRRNDLIVPVRPPPLRVHFLLAFGLAAAFLIYGRILLWTSYTPGNSVAKPEEWFVRASLVLGSAYVFFGTYRLFASRALFSPTGWIRTLASWNAILAVVLFFGTRWVQHHWSNGSNGAFDSRDMLDCTIYTSVSRPGLFSLAHALFFGPLVIFLHLRWKSIAAKLHEHGVGLALVALVGVGLSLNSESRRLFLFAPMLLPFVISELDELGLTLRQWAIVGFVGLASSKLWLSIDGGLASAPLDRPAQTLIMTVGPWMSWTTYLWQGTIVVAVTPWLWWIARERPQKVTVRSLDVAPAVHVPAPSSTRRRPAPEDRPQA
jgi:hypothetical protein